VATADKIDQKGRMSSGRGPSHDGGKNLLWAVGQLQRGETLEFGGQKLVGGCSVKVVVAVQVECVGANFALVLIVVVGDMGSLERDVSAANRRARVEDRDCFLRFPR
jgi:hypothetical protein